MTKQKYENNCSCSDVHFVIKYECEEEFDEFFCPFCGIRMDDIPTSDEETDDYDY